MKRVYVTPNRYVDSVTLMGLALSLTELTGVRGAESGMGTRQNIDMLTQQGYEVPADTGKNDMMLAVDADDGEALEAARLAAEKALAGGSRHKRVYRDINELEDGAYQVAQISLPGEYAVHEARKAIDRGMDVFMFTADVSLEEERRLKEYGRDHGRLVMGPDAGVGLLGGVALAAGSIVRFGPVGVIGASGSGSQEVACLIEEMGAGVTCILGTGGRDLKKEVGGVSMKADMQRLEMDEDTKVICLVSMLADREVMQDVLREADRLAKPVAAVFLGADEALYAGHRAVGATNLRDAAKACVRLLGMGEPKLGFSEDEIEAIAARTRTLAPEKKFFRGLYTGGTFAEETLMAFRALAPEISLCTNRDNTRYAARLKTHKVSQEHTLLDMGDLDFTAEAPHTVFDPTQRFQRFRRELEDPEVAVIAMDIILGPGVAPDPASCYLPLMRERPDVIFVCSICGGEGDPQNKRAIRQALTAAGAVVAPSNYDSARLCARICQALKER